MRVSIAKNDATPVLYQIAIQKHVSEPWTILAVLSEKELRQLHRALDTRVRLISRPPYIMTVVHHYKTSYGDPEHFITETDCGLRATTRMGEQTPFCNIIDPGSVTCRKCKRRTEKA